MSIKINFTLNENEYPILKLLKKKESEEIFNKIFKIGYDILFPSSEKVIKNMEYFELYKNIENLKSDIKNTNIITKIDDLESSLNKLVGISSNSYKKGVFAENLLEDIFKSRYGDIIYEKKANINHSGDAWLHLPDKKIIMLESKNYTYVVNKEEINKLQSDMINHNIKYGILVSFNSMVQGMKELDIHTFINNNHNYYIIIVTNISNDISKLDLGIQIIRKIMTTFTNINITQNKFILKNINEHLNELNILIEKNYMLRDNFYTMEKEISKLLSNYHTHLRNYQYDIDNKINIIVNDINITLNKSINNYKEKYNNILNKYTNYKTYNIISKLFDFCILKKWLIKNNNYENSNFSGHDNYIIYNNNNIDINDIDDIDNDNDNKSLQKKTSNIINNNNINFNKIKSLSYDDNNIVLKIQHKKIILNVFSGIILTFDIDNVKQHIVNIELLNLINL